jgi:hypothetical protein
VVEKTDIGVCRLAYCFRRKKRRIVKRQLDREATSPYVL